MREGCLEEGQAAFTVFSFVRFLPVKSSGPFLGGRVRKVLAGRVYLRLSWIRRDRRMFREKGK